MSIDIGYLEYQQRQQQNAADGAAIGAAQQLLYSGCPNGTAAQTAADNDSSENDFVNAGNVKVTANNPPLSGPFTSDNCAVQVTVNNSATPTFLMRIFGYGNVAETTQATATSLANGPGCVYQLDPNGTPTFHGAKISAPGCSLLMNGSPTFDGGDVDFMSIGYAGSLTVHGTNFDSGSPMTMLPVANPCPEIAGCNDLANNPPTPQGCIPLPAGSTVVLPGCYSSFSGSNGSAITLSPGLYTLTGSNSLNGVTLTGSGVTIYVTGTGSGLDLHGTKVDLSACTTSCTSGAVANVLYYQTNGTPVDISGPSGSYSGLFYAPNSQVTYNGNAGTGYAVMVFSDWLLNGTGQGMTFASPPPNQSFIKTAVLVQ